MDDYAGLAAAAMEIDSRDEETIEQALADNFGFLSLDGFSELVDRLLPFTVPFPSALVQGEAIQAFVREDPEHPGVYEAYVRRVLRARRTEQEQTPGQPTP